MTQLDSFIEVINIDSNEMTLHLIYTMSHSIRAEVSHFDIRVEQRHVTSGILSCVLPRIRSEVFKGFLLQFLQSVVLELLW